MKKILQSFLVLLAVGIIGFIAYRALRSNQKTPEQTQQIVANTTAQSDRVEAGSGGSQSLARNGVFASPLYASGEGTSNNIKELLDNLIGKDDPQKRALIEAWLKQNPNSPWAASLQNELAKNYQRNGHFAKANSIWDALWDELKSSEESTALLIANEVAVALLQSNVSLSRADRLKQVIADVEQRTTNGALEAALYTAKNAVWLTEHTGAQNITCGALALNALGHHLGTDYEPPSLGKVSGDYINTGLPLSKVSEFARTNYKMDHVLVERENSSVAYPTPAVVHLDNDHYIAVTEFDETTQKYFVDDRTLNFNGWIERAALEGSASGALLFAGTEIPAGFAELKDSDARRVFGRDGAHGGTNPSDSSTGDDDTSGGDGDDDCGMPRYAFHNMPAALVVRDTPIWYETVAGPDLYFRLTYNELNESRPNFFENYTGVGQDWNTDWVSWVVPVNGTVTSNTRITVHAPGGGTHTHKFDSNLDPIPNPKNQSVLVKISDTEYTRTFPSGFVETYSTPDSDTTSTKLFLTSISDPTGNALNYNYGTVSLSGGGTAKRLESVVSSATGLQMTLFYDTSGLPFRLSRVRGPFGREALIEYEDLTFDGATPLTYRISAITDMNGLRSTFEYQGSDGFMNAMVTPYGRTTFEKEGTNTNFRVITAKDPMGQREKIAFLDLASRPAAYVAPTPKVSPTSLTYPDGLTPNTAGFRLDTLVTYRNTFYWSKEGYHNGVDDPDNATITHYWTDSNWKFVPYKAGVREPHSDWVWYTYPGAYSNFNMNPDLGGDPDKIISYTRVNGEVKANLTRIEYNEHQLATKIIDVEGRETEYIYDTTFLTEVAEVRQKVGDGYETLSQTTYYAANRLPHVVTDAAGRTTTFTYNAIGQILTATDDTLNRVTTYEYGDDVYLDYIDQPFAGTDDRIFFEYDDKKRTNKITDVDGHYTITTFDDFDRPTRITFPDGTFTESTYDRLHLSEFKDRLDRVTKYTVDPLQRVTSITNPLNLTTIMEWCRCGDIRKLIDPKGQITRWEYDSAGRMIKKHCNDGSVDVFLYDQVTAQLIKSTNSATDVSIESILDDTATSIYNTKVYDYLTDGRMAGVTYEDEDTTARPATPAVSYTYDVPYGRLETMTDGIGTTTYAYYPYAVGENGAGQLQSVDGPWVDDTVVYTYDAFGRPLGQTINGVAYLSGASYDALNRLQSYSNLLGNFSQSYVGMTGRIDQMLTPVSKTTYGYTPLNNDFRLNDIHNQLTDNSTIDRFSYGLNKHGRIDSITHQIGTDTPLVKEYGYDSLDQLTSAVISQGGILQTHYAYTYDAAYNRASKQVGEYSSTSTHNEVNEHLSSTDGGPTRFYGEVDEPARVTINGELAALDSDNTYEGFLDLTAGDHDVTIEATDGNGNVSTETFNVTVLSPDPATYTYDDEGNTVTKTENGVTTTYRWDAENRLVSINQGDQVSEFYYDGLDRRVRIVEKTADVVTSEKRFIWCGSQICEERDATNQTLRHYFGNGETRTANDANPGNYYYTTDHLGSTRAVLDASGTVVARYEYTPYGDVTQTAGTLEFDFLYTGHYQHKPSNLFLTHYRAYDPMQGRWLSRDPLGAMGPDGPNLYSYVRNNPINYIDPLGLCWWDWVHGGLDALGLIPGLGIVPDAINAGLYAARGDMVNAGLSAAAMVPGAGQGVTAAKYGAKAAKEGAERIAKNAAESATNKVDDVIGETLSATQKNITSKHVLSADEALTAGEKFVGPGYKEIGKPGSGVFRSADGTRQFRMDNNSISGNHAPNVPHVHLETYAPGARKPTVNNHIPFVD